MVSLKLKTHAVMIVVVVILVVLVLVGLFYAVLPYFSSYTYMSHFEQSQMGVLAKSYWVVDPQYYQGSYSFENGMLKLVSENRFQVGFGMTWNSPTYINNDWQPWLGVYWTYHCSVSFAKPQGTSDIPFLIVENWIAFGNGQSYTAMVWYDHGSLGYSYGAFPNPGGYGVTLDHFSLPSAFTVQIDADYKTQSLNINWAGHVYNVFMQVEPVGWTPKSFTHFQITLADPGTVYVQSLNVTESDRQLW